MRWPIRAGSCGGCCTPRSELDLGAFAANHEYGRSQFEINLTHSDVLDAADRAFMFKAMVKEMAAAEGLLATFIGKPWNDDEGSGFHLHFSLVDGDGANLLTDEGGPDGLSELAMHFLAGVLEHGQSLMAFLNPTTQRLPPDHRDGPGADAGELGARQPPVHGARAARARRGDPARGAGRRRLPPTSTWRPRRC